MSVIVKTDSLIIPINAGVEQWLDVGFPTQGSSPYTVLSDGKYRVTVSFLVSPDEPHGGANDFGIQLVKQDLSVFGVIKKTSSLSGISMSGYPFASGPAKFMNSNHGYGMAIKLILNSGDTIQPQILACSSTQPGATIVAVQALSYFSVTKFA